MLFMVILISGANGYFGKNMRRVSSTSSLKKAQQEETRAIDFRLNPENIRKHKSLFLGSTLVDLAWSSVYDHEDPKHQLQAAVRIDSISAMYEHGLKKYVGIGSAHEYGPNRGLVSEDTALRPVSRYGTAKAQILEHLESGVVNRLDWNWVRCFYALGNDLEGSSFFSTLRRFRASGWVELRNPASTFDFSDVRWLGSQILNLSSQLSFAGVVNLGSGYRRSMSEMAMEFSNFHRLGIRVNREQNLREGIFPDLQRLEQIRGKNPEFEKFSHPNSPLQADS